MRAPDTLAECVACCPRQLYIPSELGYGDRSRGKHIKGGDVLVFTLELIEITGDKVPAADREEI